MQLALTPEDSVTEPVALEVEIPKPGLQFAWLEITDQCNERCLHCYGSFSPNKKEEIVKQSVV